MLSILKKTKAVFNNEVLIYVSIAYIVLKNIIVADSTYLTYIYMMYCLLYFIIYRLYYAKFQLKDYFLSILFIISFLISTFINNRLNRENVAIIIDVFINLFVYLHIFDGLDNEEIECLLRKIFKFFTIFSFVWAIIGIAFIITNTSVVLFGNQFGMINHTRLQLVRPSVNPTGFAAIAFVACNLYFLFKKVGFNRTFLIINIILQFIIIFFTQSFGAFLAMFIGFFVLAVYYGVHNKCILRFVLYTLFVIVAFLILGIVLTNILGIKSRITTDIKNLLSNKDAFRVRYEIFIYGLLVLLNTNVLFGSSYGGLKMDWVNQFNSVSSKYQFSSYFLDETAIVGSAATHNAYFTILFANGIVGALILLIFVTYILYNVVVFYINFNKIDMKMHILYLVCIFLIISGMAIALTAECIIVSIVDYTNFFLFISMSALVNINKNYRLTIV